MFQIALSLKLAHQQVFNMCFCSSQWNSIQWVKWFNNSMFNSIFDELKEVRYFARNNRFQESFNVKYFQEIKRLKSLQVKAVLYLEPKRASMMKILGEYTNTCIAIKERITCIITTETAMCIMHCRKYHLHNCN